MMAFRVEWHKKALKELRGMPRELARQLVLKAGKLADNPMHSSFPLEGCNLRKIRSGDYRAVISVDGKKRFVRVLLVGHRKTIYKRLFR